jgi:small subunit ribosomal protein S6
VNEYELMLIVHPRLNADETTAAVEAVQARIAGHGGELLSSDTWGRRRLAYPINGVLDGTYVLMTLRLDPGVTAPLEAWLRIQESVLRHLLIRGIIPFQGHRREERRDDDRREDREAVPAGDHGRSEDADTSDDGDEDDAD